jgi:hypothetical protein
MVETVPQLTRINGGEVAGTHPNALGKGFLSNTITPHIAPGFSSLAVGLVSPANPALEIIPPVANITIISYCCIL